jgi:hypothetical protein
MIYFPRIVQDDFNLTKFHSLDDAASLKDALNKELMRAVELNGAGFFSFHSQVFGQLPQSTWVGEFLQEHRDKSIWYANFRQMANWWTARSAVAVKSHTFADSRMQIEVRNTSAKDVQDIALLVDVDATKFELPDGLSVVQTDGADSAKLLLPPMKPGEKVLIDLQGSDFRRPASRHYGAKADIRISK